MKKELTNPHYLIDEMHEKLDFTDPDQAYILTMIESWPIERKYSKLRSIYKETGAFKESEIQYVFFKQRWWFATSKLSEEFLMGQVKPPVELNGKLICPRCKGKLFPPARCLHCGYRYEGPSLPRQNRDHTKTIKRTRAKTPEYDQQTVLDIRSLAFKGYTYVEIANHLNVTWAHVSAIARGKMYEEVGGKVEGVDYVKPHSSKRPHDLPKLS